MDNARFFNIGMKNRILSNNAESYRIISGTKADVAVTETDGNLYDRGHVFGKGETSDGAVTIGYSSLSKVWSSKPLQIPQSIQWCREVASKISNEAPVQTGSGLDHLSVGTQLTEIPANVITADWDEGTYKNAPQVLYKNFDGTDRHSSLLDLEIVVDKESTTDSSIHIGVVGVGMECSLEFSLDSRPHFEQTERDNHELMVDIGRQPVAIVDYLNQHLPHFYCADFSRLHGNQFYSTRSDDLIPFDPERIEAVDWIGNDVDIEVEFGSTTNGKISIHDFLRSHLNRDEFEVVVYDHRTGEIADLITFSESEIDIVVRLYHCKGSGGEAPGNRVGDVYEVCGQIVKSLKWMSNKAHLIATLQRRIDGGSEFIRGDFESITRLLSPGNDKPVRFQVALVQPGLSKSNLSEDSGFVLAAAADYFRRTKAENLVVLASP